MKKKIEKPKCDKCQKTAFRAERDLYLKPNSSVWADWEPGPWRYGCADHWPKIGRVYWNPEEYFKHKGVKI
jgi:hypothetical protein